MADTLRKRLSPSGRYPWLAAIAGLLPLIWIDLASLLGITAFNLSLPLPFLDLLAVAWLQMAMMRRMGLNQGQQTLPAGEMLIRFANGFTLARVIVSLCRLLPFVGNILGGALQAALAYVETRHLADRLQKHLESGEAHENFGFALPDSTESLQSEESSAIAESPEPEQVADSAQASEAPVAEEIEKPAESAEVLAAIPPAEPAFQSLPPIEAELLSRPVADDAAQPATPPAKKARTPRAERLRKLKELEGNGDIPPEQLEEMRQKLLDEEENNA